MNFKNLSQLMVSTLILLPLYLCAAIYDGPTDDATFTALLKQVNEKSSELDKKVEEAIAVGVNVDYAQVSQTTVRLFKDIFAPWDRNHPEVVQQMYDAVYFSRFDPVGPTGLPFDELLDCIDVVDSAIAQLQQQIDGNITLATPPDFSTKKIKLQGTHYQLGDDKVFASKFFWQPNTEDVMQAFGRSGEGYLSVQHLETENKIKNWSKSSLRSSIAEQTAQNRAPIQYFLGHIVPQSFWLREDYPQAFDGSRIFTDYDIDNPNTKAWLNVLFEEQLSSAIEPLGDNERVHMIANEPMFSIREGGVESARGVSEFTMNKYQAWLEHKYDTISQLNVVYQTSFNNFSEVKNTYIPPISLSFQGGPIWYDWNKFNLERGNQWFQFLHDGVHNVDPHAKTHVKVMGERSVHTPYQDEGLDFEFITNLVDMPGSDAQMSSFAAEWDLRHEQNWRQRYSLEWRAQSIMLDFMKSIAPDKHMYDSEWHNLSGSRWRDFHMSPEYVRATFYLGITHGLGSVTTWVWNRKSDGAIDTRADFIGTSVTQPIQLDAYGRAWKEINAHGNLALSLTPVERDFMVYYNKDAAIQDPKYTLYMSEMYEALKLQNVAVGFATPSTLDSLNPSSQTLFLSATRFISDEDLTGLQSFAQRGGNIVLMDDDNNFTKTELGQTRTSGVDLAVYARFQRDNVLAMLEELQVKVSMLVPHKDVDIVVKNAELEVVHGVLLSQASLTSGSATAGNEQRRGISLINTSQQTVNVKLLSSIGKVSGIVDVITGNNVENNIEMQPMDVQLLQLDLLEGVSDIEVHSIEIQSSATSLTVGEKLTLTADILPTDATDKTLHWSSSNSNVATVDNNGNVTAVAAGNVQITATSQLSLVADSISLTINEQAVVDKPENQNSSGGSLPWFFLVALIWVRTLRQSSSPLFLGASND
ncbi:Ig-like domain-containing protein [Psychrosphaera sp. 1_MG-2023]|nr:Ig-like domain-containing protein [Psychrosphaera sp. 1_MG-2023]MDO6719926.1 Ig-like domain-containing protein [Psychrosphaera sp. 1_MG-2023]